MKAIEERLKLLELERQVMESGKKRRKAIFPEGSIPLLIAILSAAITIVSLVHQKNLELDLEDKKFQHSIYEKAFQLTDSTQQIRLLITYQKLGLIHLDSLVTFVKTSSGKDSAVVPNPLPRDLQYGEPTTKRAACKTIDVTKLPGYSPSNRYFHQGDLKNSFLINSHVFDIYQGGGPDTYKFDSIQKCSETYEFYFTNAGSQERINPDPARLEITPHRINCETQMGIFSGVYELVFDFKTNEKSDFVPVDDLGKWQVYNGGSGSRLVINKNKTLSLGQSEDSMHLPLYRITRIRIDLIDHSALYDVKQVDSAGHDPSGIVHILIKHGNPNAVFLSDFGSNIENSIAQTMIKVK